MNLYASAGSLVRILNRASLFADPDTGAQRGEVAGACAEDSDVPAPALGRLAGGFVALTPAARLGGMLKVVR